MSDLNGIVELAETTSVLVEVSSDVVEFDSELFEVSFDEHAIMIKM
tara:strand:- start:859 stop:996 length:138 start_codon:yes stop_codon:yes gene_type:complete